MTTTKQPHRSRTGKLSMAEILEVFAATGRHPLKFTAYDGSTAGSEDAELGLDLRSPRGATYLATAPGELGLARATWPATCRPTACIRVIRTGCSRR